MKLHIHTVIPLTKVNGPGSRFGIWVQGCSRNCAGCFNPETHSFEQGYKLSIDELFNQVTGAAGSHSTLCGISISGGEPFEQEKGLLLLLKKIKLQTKLSVLVFTGFTLEEIKKDIAKKELLFYIDILIAGPYKESLATKELMLSSSNQKIHFLSEQYSYEDLDAGDVELIIDPEGVITLTGCSPPDIT
ncbi:MAG: radical SAM protein [bacterium]|nr:radical SAM protein [bacterium]